MAIVSEFPFELKLIQKFPVLTIQNAEKFCMNEKQIWEDNFVTLFAEENDEIDIYFNSNDKDARLYLDALDIMPNDDANIFEDENGRIYRTISDSCFVLYKSNAGYDALRVDSFKISIYCQKEWYYGVFQILPKPMSLSEWHMMKNDLEDEIRGLAQDIVRRNIGIGDIYSEKLPPKIVYDFMVMKRYSKKVMMALMDISEHPRSEIITKYENISTSKSDSYKFDAETVKRYVMKSGSEATFKVPVKSINYDTQDNRLLKMILLDYENKLDQFVGLIENVEKYSNSPNSGGSLQYKISWNKSLGEFKNMAVKLRKMTAILKAQDWYSEIGIYREPYIPHSFILDTRYNILYQMYLDLKKEELNVELDSEFSYTWKRSSYMYEMWCFLKVCRIILSEYELVTTSWNFIFSDKVLFPFLEEGTKLEFEKNNIRIEVIYDKCLPLKQEKTSINNPLFMAKHHSDLRTHNRPDILINVYEISKQWYLGSIILECKYRKINSFWQETSSRSSRGQLETYYNNARSSFLLGGIGETLQIHPVTKVFVLTPDDFGEGKEQKDFNIVIKSYKASDAKDRQETVKEDLIKEIRLLERRFEEIQKLKTI